MQVSSGGLWFVVFYEAVRPRHGVSGRAAVLCFIGCLIFIFLPFVEISLLYV
ncbi:hypothetical protein l13_09080 [Neisseria weaveri ATCC 51223]|nr:hypothetical protein l13_09080 [Neisseria weaveri ATCC 51223]